MPGAGWLGFERADDSCQIVVVTLAPAQHVVGDGIPPENGMWVWDDHEREVPRLLLLVLLQPSLHENIVEIRSIMQLIPYPALVNQPDSTSNDNDCETQADHHRHPGVSMTVLLHLRLEDRPVLDELIHSCEQDNY